MGDIEEKELLVFCEKCLDALEAETDMKTPYAGYFDMVFADDGEIISRIRPAYIICLYV